MFTPYGSSTMTRVFILCFLLGTAAIFFPFWVESALFGFISLIILFTLYFFRDPERKAPDEERIILAPADGKIILIQPRNDSFTGNGSTLLSIFMSPFNVHVNRIPLSGRVSRINYHTGQFFMAFDPRSMESNEKMEIGIDNGEIRVLFSQISGFLARRIVCKLQNNEAVTRGARFGMIKFGSRVDIILPPSASLLVQTGQITQAGQTILARY